MIQLKSLLASEHLKLGVIFFKMTPFLCCGRSCITWWREMTRNWTSRQQPPFTWLVPVAIYPFHPRSIGARLYWPPFPLSPQFFFFRWGESAERCQCPHLPRTGAFHNELFEPLRRREEILLVAPRYGNQDKLRRLTDTVPMQTLPLSKLKVSSDLLSALWHAGQDSYSSVLI